MTPPLATPHFTAAEVQLAAAKAKKTCACAMPGSALRATMAERPGGPGSGQGARGGPAGLALAPARSQHRRLNCRACIPELVLDTNVVSRCLLS